MLNRTNRFVYCTLVLIILVIGAVQFSQPFIIGADGFLHGQMADMIARHGFLRALPQAHFSWFVSRFSDKDFLYHLYLIPFIRLFAVMFGTKIAAFIATASLGGIIVYMLTIYSRPLLLIPIGLSFLASAQFLRDTAEARPFIFAMILTVLGIHAVISNKPKFAFIVSLIYGMMHLSAWVLVVYTIVWEVYRWVAGEKGDRKILFAVIGGYLVSFFVHPNFPNNIFINFLNGVLVPWYAFRGGVLELGAEFFPLNTQDVLYRFPVLVAGLAATLGSIFLVPTHLRKATIGWGLATLLFGFFAIISVRNMTHLYPVFIIWLGALLADVSKGFSSLDTKTVDRVKSLIIPSMIIFFLYAGFQTYSMLSQMLLSDKIYAVHFINMASIIRQSVPPGSRIFHTNWSDSQYFIGLAPEYEYFVTLDPVYMYTYDSTLYQLYRDVSFGRNPDPYKALTKNFGSYYGYAGKNYFGGFIDQIRKDNRFSIIAEDELGLVFSISRKPSENTQ
jgi:hypothetical protein